jgi:hypothetical protein
MRYKFDLRTFLFIALFTVSSILLFTQCEKHPSAQQEILDTKNVTPDPNYGKNIYLD